MKVAVWDTYVTRADGRIMHFDILVPDELKDEKQVLAFGRSYLKTKGEENQALSSEECSFCHIEQATSKIQKEIGEKGYSIIEMENC